MIDAKINNISRDAVENQDLDQSALPSCIVPMENNYLINIHHADFQSFVQQSK